MLCDETTYIRACQWVKFSEAHKIMVKGKANEILAYKPIEVRNLDDIRFLCRNLSTDARLEQELPTEGAGATFEGRKDELKQLHRLLETVGSTGENVVVLVEGEPGMGRTTLVKQFAANLQDNETCPAVFYAKGLLPSISPENIIPELSPFRGMVAGLWGGLGDESEEAKERLEEELEQEGLDNASIFNALLDLRVPETRPASMLTKNSRRKRQINLIVNRMQKVCISDHLLPTIQLFRDCLPHIQFYP